MVKDKEGILKGIVLLESLGVGCGPECGCRGLVARSLSDTQTASLEAAAKAVVFDHKKPPEEKGVLELLGPSANAFQVTALDRIAEDKLLPDRHPEEKGGRLGAERTFEKLRSLDLVFGFGNALARVVGGDLDIANMSDDDIRNAAYSRR